MKGDISKYLMQLFCNRKDVHAKQFLNSITKKKGFSCEKKPITLELLQDHLDDKHPMGVYQLDSNNNIKWICFDFDEDTKEDYKKAGILFLNLKANNFNPLMEKSGGGEYKVHVWIFCNPTNAQQAKKWGESICKKAAVKPHELFPKQTELTEGGYGNLVKLPLGINLSTGKKSVIIDQFNTKKEITQPEEIEKFLKKYIEAIDVIPEIIEEKVIKHSEIKEDIKTNHDVQINQDVNEFDDFFNFIINNELPQGISVSKKEGSITGINDNILKNEAIWFSQKGYTLERLEKEIKPIFQEHKWTFGDLKGWFNKAIKGDLTQISKGELINWCKTYYPDLRKILPYDSPYLEIKDLKYNINHLPKYEHLDKSIQLIGEEYKLFKKDAYNLLISLACPERLLNIRIGQIETDLRIHPLFIIPSGKGKLGLKEGIKSIYLKFKSDANIKEPRTIHYQQLIGKVLKRKEKKDGGKSEDTWIKKFGFLFSDLLILEESYELLTSNEKNDVDARDALLVGLDIYNKNFIQKQNIDNLDIEEETIEGYPHVRCLAFTQPLQFPEKFVSKGSQRRFSVNYREFPKKTNTDIFAERLNSVINNEESANEFAMFMKRINDISNTWNFSKESFEIFVLCHRALLDLGYSKPGKQSNFTNIIEFPLQNLLLKISALRSLSNLRTTITGDDILYAYCDIVERFVHELNFVDNKITGLFDYGNTWNGAIGKQQESLEWLWNRGAKSKGSSQTSIFGFQNRISSIFDISVRRARDRYNKMKEEGLIEDYKGVHDSKVWLTFEPKLNQFQSGQSSQTGHLSKQIYNFVIQSGKSGQDAVCNISNKLFSYIQRYLPVTVQSGQAVHSENTTQSDKKEEISKNE